MKSTSHQNKGAPRSIIRKENLIGIWAEQECRVARLSRNVGFRKESTDDILAPAIITVTWSRL